MNILKQIVSFITTDIWRIRLKTYPKKKSFFITQLRIILLAIRGYKEDKCHFRASALTFYSLLSIVPVIAMIFGIAKGFGIEKLVEKQLLEKMQGQEEVITKIIGFATSLLENTKGGFVAGVGIIILFWSVMKVLGNIEIAFNVIWGVKRSRHFGRKFSDYLSIMLVCPILLVLSGSMTVVISSQIKILLQKIPFFTSLLGAIILPSLKILPYCSLWIMFTFIFLFMPNTKVKFKSGLLAGIVAGTIFQLVQWAYISFQIGVAKYGAIYGSFAALPLFLMWLQISWLIVLFGAELSFAHQNVDTYEFEQDCLAISHSYKKLLSLLVTHLLIKNFCKGEKPSDADQISHALEIPIRLVRQILFELNHAGIVSQAEKDDSKELAYQPARDVDTLTVKSVLDSLDNAGQADIPVLKTEQLTKLLDCLKSFSENNQKSPNNILLKDI